MSVEDLDVWLSPIFMSRFIEMIAKQLFTTLNQLSEHCDLRKVSRQAELLLSKPSTNNEKIV